jgi:hypothetical protein
MKQTIIALAAATLVSGGLVGVSAESAQATCPYTGCVRTYTKVVHVPSGPVAKGHRAKLCVTVTTGGNGHPKGRVNINVRRQSGKAVLLDSKTYNGRTCFKTGKLNKTGKYIVRAKFDAAANSPFTDSDNTTTFRVKKY